MDAYLPKDYLKGYWCYSWCPSDLYFDNLYKEETAKEIGGFYVKKGFSALL